MHENAKKMLDELKPDLVIFFNGRYLEIRPMMRLCEERGIHFQTHERGGTIGKYISAITAPPHSLKTSPANRRWLECCRSGPRRNRAEVFCGQAEQDHAIVDRVYGRPERGSLPADFDRNRKNVVLYNSSLDEYEGIAGISGKIYIPRTILASQSCWKHLSSAATRISTCVCIPT